MIQIASLFVVATIFAWLMVGAAPKEQYIAAPLTASSLESISHANLYM